MKITVILCTYNRCEVLRGALDSVAVLTLPEGTELEVLVVDNNSNDQTSAVIDDFCRQHPGRFRYLFESEQGKSRALNAGIRAAQGDILAFMDDDVIVDKMWLQNLTAPLDDERWQGAGGRILPGQTFVPPRWLALEERYALAPLAMFDLGNDTCELAEAPFGTNMAFRKSMFQKHGGFRTDLGPRPGSEIRNEDTEFGRRLLVAGERLCYVPSAVVYHPVTDTRLEKEYFLAWWFAKGRADIREFGPRPNTIGQLWGVPLYLFRNLLMWTLRWMVAVQPSVRFQRKIKVWSKGGEILECYQQSVGATKTP